MNLVDTRKFSISLETDAGKEELLKYVRREVNIKEEHEERVLKRFRLLARKLKYKSFLELLEYLKKSPEAFSVGLDWLKRGKVFDESKKQYTQLVDKKKKLTAYAQSKPRMQSSRQRRERRRRRAEILRSQALREQGQTDDGTINIKDPIDPENLELVLRVMTDNNINQDAYKTNYIIRRLNHRMRRTSHPTYKAYAEFLMINREEVTNLQKSLSINVTHFFRDKEVFKAIERKVLPEIFSENTGPINIWSAGCAMGAEPYTIAMIIDNSFKAKDKLRTNILATDISYELISKAKERVFYPDLLRETDKKLILKYFTKKRDEYLLSAVLNRYIEYKVHDLQTTPPARNLDLILCRNVLIYFSVEQTQILFERFYKALKKGGILVIGKCEILRGEIRKSFEVIDSKNRIYQKK